MFAPASEEAPAEGPGSEASLLQEECFHNHRLSAVDTCSSLINTARNYALSKGLSVDESAL